MCMIAGTSTIRIRVASSRTAAARPKPMSRSEEHTSELQSQSNLVCRLLLEKKKKNQHYHPTLLKHPIFFRIRSELSILCLHYHLTPSILIFYVSDTHSILLAIYRLLFSPIH